MPTINFKAVIWTVVIIILLGLSVYDAGAEIVEFNLDEAGDMAEETEEELLDTSDEVGTKLDLARAYLDMGDPEGARSILEEVLEEGNDNQKREAEDLFAQLA